MSKEIQLTKGFTTTVDDEDYERLNAKRWCYSCGYAMRKENKFTIYLHREVLLFPVNLVDHIDSNKLNNTKRNLRITTKSVNALNSTKPRGVIATPTDKFRAQLSINGVKVLDKCYTTYSAARQAYLTAKATHVSNVV